jgi:sugar lactone lactonase YvrE
MRKIKVSTILALSAILLLLLPVSAAAPVFPDLIELPVGFRPEGIAVGRGSTFFTGSLANGAIYRGDLRTGEGDILVAGQAGMVSVGMAYDRRSNALFVAGGGTGLARVFDADSGALLATYQLTAPGSFINDVIITRDAAYFTNSALPELYRLPLGPGGALPDPSEVEVIPLSGDWQQVAGFNANGIEASPNGKWLIVVNSTLGNLYRVDPDTGEAVLIDLGGESVSAGDGLLLRGSLLYVVRNQLNQIVVIDLSADYTSGTVVNRLTNPNFMVPTTAASFGNALYAVNAKFGNPTPNDIPYEVVRVPLR